LMEVVVRAAAAAATAVEAAVAKASWFPRSVRRRRRSKGCSP